jgi:hypothetical protein
MILWKLFSLLKVRIKIKLFRNKNNKKFYKKKYILNLKKLLKIIYMEESEESKCLKK